MCSQMSLKCDEDALQLPEQILKRTLVHASPIHNNAAKPRVPAMNLSLFLNASNIQ